MNSFGQDIASLKNQKPITIGAGLQIGSYFSATQGRSQVTSPLGYYLNANTNVSIYGLKIPLSISFRDQKLNYTKPMFRLGISPSYKWVKLYLGHSQMNFSNYTLSGMIFNGGGFSINPKKFRLALMAGKMQSPRAIQDSIEGKPNYIQPYQRFGMGAKIGVGSSSNFVDFILFNGKDKRIADGLPDSTFINPVENTVVGLQSQLSMFNNVLQLQWNVGLSAHTNNKNASPIENPDDAEKYITWGEKLMTVNASTRLNIAGDALVRLNFQNFHIGAKYQYIDPGYTSLGTYYFKDDNENYAIDMGLAVWENKISIDGSYGLQRNNLTGHRSLGSLQNIYDLSLNIVPSNNYGITAQYSNFNFNQVSGLVQINDSLRFGQINANTSLAPFINFGNKNVKQSININYSNQKIKDLSFDELFGQDAQIQSVNLSYNLTHKPNAFTFNSSIQYLNSNYNGDLSSRMGMFLTGSKRIFGNKLQARLQINFSKNNKNKIEDGNQYGGNAALNWKVGKNNNFNFQLNYIDRNALSGRSYSEWRGSTSLNIQLK